MPPGWVNTLEDYWVWIEQLIDSGGGYIADDEVVFIVPVVDYDGGPWLALNVERSRLHYYDGSYLAFQFVVSLDLLLEEYNFHYARADDTLVWRYDLHAGHEHEDDGRSHVHLPDGRRRRHEPVDLEHVLNLVKADQAERAG